MAVSSHALTANFHVPQNRDLGKWLGDSFQSFSNGFIKKSQGMKSLGLIYLFEKILDFFWRGYIFVKNPPKVS